MTIDVSFVTEVALRQSEALTFHMPDFGDGSTAATLLVSTRPLGVLEPTATWVPKDFELTVVLLQSLPVGGSLNLTIYKDEMFTFRSQGLSISGPDIRLKTATVPFHAIRSIDAVGRFMDSRLEFTSRVVDMPTDLDISFTPMMNIALGESIVAKLPDFTGEQKSQHVCSSSAICFQASWTSLASELQLVFDRALERGQAVSIRVPQSFGLNLPADGVTLNQASPKLSTAAVDGVVVEESFASVEQVGIFYHTPVLVFAPESAPGNPSVVTIKDLAFASPMKPDELITVNLKGFEIEPFETLAVRSSTNHLFFASCLQTVLLKLLFS